LTPTATTATPPPDRLAALERANEIRRARAQLKAQLASGQRSAAEVILDPPLEAHTWPVMELLATQRHWGAAKARRLLAQNRISELKPIGELTGRQRCVLAADLKRQTRARAVVRPRR
jgi:hypothetical protein